MPPRPRELRQSAPCSTPAGSASTRGGRRRSLRAYTASTTPPTPFPPKLNKIALTQCSFSRGASHALLNYLVLRHRPSNGNFKIKHLTIRQEEVAPAGAFPRWLLPQLTRLVPDVELTANDQSQESVVRGVV